MFEKSNAIKHFTASALIVNSNNEVLLIKHNKLGVWLYPGGHVEGHETPDETVLREVREETGLDVEIIGGKDESLDNIEAGVTALHLPYVILCERIIGENEHYHIDLVYLCRVVNRDENTVTYDPRESEGIGYFHVEDLEELDLFPNFRKLLEKLLQNGEI